MKSFVLGNGKSRLNIDPRELRPYGKIYGCNALYREYEPDYLIAVDPKMIFEINESGYQKTHEVWTNPNARYKNFNGFNYFQPSLGWSSGPTALELAARHHPTEIYFFGFDLEGIAGKFNNVYADTKNYKRSVDHATYYGNWQRQTEKVISDHKNIKFFRVVEDKYYDPNWHMPNFRHLRFTELRQQMRTWLKKV